MNNTDAIRATFSAFAKSAWISLGLGTLMLAAAIKLALVDGAFDIVAYPLVGALGFAFWPAVSFAMVGTLEAHPDAIRWRRRIGLAGSIMRHEIERIERCGSRRSDTLGIRIVPKSGKPIDLPRVRPEAMIALLEDYGAGPRATVQPLPDRAAFAEYAQGRVPNAMR